MKTKSILFLLFIIVYSSSVFQASAEWDAFKGDYRNTGYVESSPKPPLELIWKKRVGLSYASHIIHNEIIYSGSQYGDIFALDIESGNLVWETYISTDEIRRTSKSAFAIYGDILFVNSWDTAIFGLNKNTGNIEWEYHSQYNLSEYSHSGYFIQSSPVIYNDIGIVGLGDNYIHAINVTNGELVWVFPVNHVPRSSPALYKGLVYFGAGMGGMDDHLYCVNASNGQLVWKKQHPVDIVSSPAVDQDVVYFGASYDGVNAYNYSTGDQIWKYPIGDYSCQSSPSVDENFVYISTGDWSGEPTVGNLLCLNKTTGNLIWDRSGYYARISPVVSDKYVYCGEYEAFSISPSLQILNKTNGELVWESPQIAGYTIPCIYEDKIVYGGYDGNIYCAQEVTGNITLTGNMRMNITDTELLHSGNIHLYGNSSINIINATLQILQPESDNWHKYDLYLHDNATLRVVNSTITSSPTSVQGYYFFAYDQSRIFVENSFIDYPAALPDARGNNVKVDVKNSTIDYFNVDKGLDMNVSESIVDIHIWGDGPSINVKDCPDLTGILFRMSEDAYAEFSLIPGYIDYWSLQENETVIGFDVDLEITNSDVGRWQLYSNWVNSTVKIADSDFNSITTQGKSLVRMTNSVVNRLSSEDSSKFLGIGSQVDRVSLHDSAVVELFNTTLDNLELIDGDAMLKTGWVIGARVKADNVLTDHYVSVKNIVTGQDFSGLTDSNGSIFVCVPTKVYLNDTITTTNLYNVSSQYMDNYQEHLVVITGNTVVDITHKSVEDVTLNTGWNLVSPEGQGIDIKIPDFFGSKMYGVESVFGWNPDTQSWVYWICGLSDEMNTLNSLSSKYGYWVYYNPS